MFPSKKVGSSKDAGCIIYNFWNTGITFYLHKPSIYQDQLGQSCIKDSILMANNEISHNMDQPYSDNHVFMGLFY